MFVELRSVTKVFNGGQPNEVLALNKIDLQVGQGEMICLQGPSGSGKTTLLSVIGCIVPPTSGYAAIGGKKISRLPDYFLTRYRRETVGVVFQDYNLLPYLSVLDNVSLPLFPLGYSPRRRSQIVDRLLERFELLHRRDFLVSQLSGGELQRTAIARALIHNPPLIVADEPTAHLDSSLVRIVMDTFAGLKAEGRTIVLTSHDPAVAAFPGIDRVVSMDGGILLRAGSGG